jgi:hypothetical protein
MSMTTREANIVAGLIVLSIACQVGPIIWDKTHRPAPSTAEACASWEKRNGAGWGQLTLTSGEPGQVLSFDADCASGMKWTNP